MDNKYKAIRLIDQEFIDDTNIVEYSSFIIYDSDSPIIIRPEESGVDNHPYSGEVWSKEYKTIEEFEQYLYGMICKDYLSKYNEQTGQCINWVKQYDIIPGEYIIRNDNDTTKNNRVIINRPAKLYVIKGIRPMDSFEGVFSSGMLHLANYNANRLDREKAITDPSVMKDIIDEL